MKLKQHELLSDTSEDLVRLNLQHIETNGLRNGPTFTGGDDVSFFGSEARRNVDGNVGVSLLVPLVFLNVVEVVSPDDDGTVHLGGNDHSFYDPASDGGVGCERALLVDVGSLDSFLGSPEAQADVLIVADSFLSFLGKKGF